MLCLGSFSCDALLSQANGLPINFDTKGVFKEKVDEDT